MSKSKALSVDHQLGEKVPTLRSETVRTEIETFYFVPFFLLRVQEDFILPQSEH